MLQNPLGQQSPFGFGQPAGSSTQPGALGADGTLNSILLNRLMNGAANPQADNQPGNPVQPRLSRAIQEKSEFERFVEDAVGHPLPVYARELFEEVPTTFAPMDQIPVPADYVIGPGDELLIRVWGKVDLDLALVVDRNGQIQLPKAGTLTVSGLRYDQLNSYLHSSIGTIYKDFELNVTLGKLRSIQVFVLGDARQPGSYTLSSLSTLVDALFASGGPSANGSMRHIQLRRGDQQVVDFDLYELQQNGDKSHDKQLLPGDVIYIPPVGPQVAIDGSVNRPGIYELRGAGTVGSALEGAGGITGLAAVDRISLERILDRKSRSVEAFELNEAGLQRPLRDGDLLRVSPSSPKFEAAVTLRGNVSGPGRFPWHEGMRISDLIPSRAFLITRDHWEQQNHLADQQNLVANALILKKESVPDEQHGKQTYRDQIAQDLQSAQGEIQPDKPQSNPPDAKPAIDVMGDLALTNAEINWDYAIIERLDPDLSTRLIPFHLADAIDNPASPENQVLRSGDVVTIFSKEDIQLPLDKHTVFVRVGGEVNCPGVYRMKPGETLRDLITRAGGLTSHSYLYASQLKRVSTLAIQKEQLKLSLQRMRAELLYQSANTNSSTSAMPTTQASASEMVAEHEMDMRGGQQLLDLLASAEPVGRIVLGIRPDAKSIEDIPELTLEDGDELLIPAEIGTVQVAGEVY
ncbi:MAG: SLBB domain-containing protein, partial [Acidobacteriaceae bacterium]